MITIDRPNHVIIFSKTLTDVKAGWNFIQLDLFHPSIHVQIEAEGQYLNKPSVKVSQPSMALLDATMHSTFTEEISLVGFSQQADILLKSKPELSQVLEAILAAIGLPEQTKGEG